jgi:hypothetical protein
MYMYVIRAIVQCHVVYLCVCLCVFVGVCMCVSRVCVCVCMCAFVIKLLIQVDRVL